MNRLMVVFLISLLVLSACGGEPASREASGTPSPALAPGASVDSTQGKSAPVVLTSTTFLADIARNVAGDRVRVESLLAAGADPHEYQAVPSDVQKISESKMVILNGLDYDQFIQPLLENAGGTRLIITASDGLAARQMTEETGQTVTDPHMWMTPTRIIKYVENIRAGLIQIDPDGESIYNVKAEAYTSQLNELHTWIAEQVAQIPQQRRLLVTNHDSLGYFAEEYGFTVIGTIIPGVSSEAAPSARQMAALIDEIKSTGAPAVFLNISDNPQLAEQIAAETSIKVVTDIYIETLSPSDGPAATYVDMIKYDVSQIVNALK